MTIMSCDLLAPFMDYYSLLVKARSFTYMCLWTTAIGLLAYKYGTRSVWNHSGGAIYRAGSSAVTGIGRTMTGMVSR